MVVGPDGIVEADLRGNSTSEWFKETVTFIPSGLHYPSDLDSPPIGQGPLFWVLNQHGIQRPPLHTYNVCFSVQQWAPFVSLSQIFDQGQSINAGFGVTQWRPTHFHKGVNFRTGGAVDNVFNVFTGINADLAARDTDAVIYKLSYHITLLGKIVSAAQNSLHD